MRVTNAAVKGTATSLSSHFIPNNVDIYISERNGTRSIRVPWLPEKINYKIGATTFVSYDIMNHGPVVVPTGSELAEISWESEFPGQQRTDTSMMRGTWQKPDAYHSILEDWKKNGTPLRVMATGYPINKDVYLDEYEAKATGGFGDIAYEISFIEDRDITIQATKVETPPKKRQETQSSTISYTIKKGDTLWGISSKFLGAGSKWQTIYNANKDIIEATAKKYGKKSSNNGWWIYPGVTLKIPK